MTEIKNILLPKKVQRYAKWFAVFLLVAFLAQSLARFIYSFDEDKPRVESFLLSSNLVFKRAGDIKNLSLKNILNFSGDTKKASYKKYWYSVEGSSGTILVTVELEKSCNSGDKCFKLTFN